MICLGRPSQSPVKSVLMAPKKQPMLYRLVMVPCMLAEGLPKVSRKFWLMIWKSSIREWSFGPRSLACAVYLRHCRRRL